VRAIEVLPDEQALQSGGTEQVAALPEGATHIVLRNSSQQGKITVTFDCKVFARREGLFRMMFACMSAVDFAP